MDKLILSENGVLIFLAIVAIGFTICWTIFIHYLKEEKRAIVESIINGGFLSILTVIMVVIAVWLFGMTGHIEEKTITTILSGIVGYVLGSLGSKRKKED